MEEPVTPHETSVVDDLWKVFFWRINIFIAESFFFPNTQGKPRLRGVWERLLGIDKINYSTIVSKENGFRFDLAIKSWKLLCHVSWHSTFAPPRNHSQLKGSLTNRITCLKLGSSNKNPIKEQRSECVPQASLADHVIWVSVVLPCLNPPFFPVRLWWVGSYWRPFCGFLTAWQSRLQVSNRSVFAGMVMCVFIA